MRICAALLLAAIPVTVFVEADAFVPPSSSYYGNAPSAKRFGNGKRATIPLTAAASASAGRREQQQRQRQQQQQRRRRMMESWSSTALEMSGGDETAAAVSTEGTATIPDEIFNLVKSIVGAGVLSLPAGIAAFGNAPSALIPATILTIAIGAISAYTFMLIARVCKMTGATSYADAWDRTRGTKTSWVVALSSALDCFMGNLSYSMILADSIRDLLSTFSIVTTRTRSLVGVMTLVLLPLCLVKNLSTLAPFSLLGIIGMAYTSFAIGIRYFGGAYAAGGKFLPDIGTALQPSFGTTGASGVVSGNSLILVCMLSTAYIAHFNAPRFLRELKDNTMSRFGKVTGVSFGISTAIYAAVSAMAFLTFGANCDGLILNNYSTRDLLISASRFAVAVSLIFSYPLLFVGTRDGTLDLMKIPEEKRTASLLNQTTFALLSITTALAWKLTDLSFIASISGAVFGTALIFVYPTLMFRGAIKNLGDKATDGQKREGKFAMIVNLLGIAIAAIGTKMSLAGVGAH
eukprot:CAMPEP_0181106324 /NCGR_PEP_ID=MMETSP1071-20121207/16472_1 /TAXON_ID=35127 /ORGANISM="Thalassiosira sp., Strain NH16" /LENGTH=518 /DNA_ID=CAMNT_0023189725 /DNA_START=269 /DNA_END=1825 /DNA_ORIENTATION=-